MKKLLGYKIIHGRGGKKFQDEVLKECKAGWELVGGIVPTGTHDSKNYAEYVQTMALYSES